MTYELSTKRISRLHTIEDFVKDIRKWVSEDPVLAEIVCRLHITTSTVPIGKIRSTLLSAKEYGFSSHGTAKECYRCRSEDLVTESLCRKCFKSSLEGSE